MSNNVEQAIFYYEQAIKAAPDWPMLRHVIAALYLQINDVKSAEYHAQKALEYFKPLTSLPKNFIEDYYEDAVTGKSWTNYQNKSEKLFACIQDTKKNLSS